MLQSSSMNTQGALQESEVECILCESAISPSSRRSFNFSERAYLCYGCAVSKGGIYDFQRECWAILPDMTAEDDTGSWW